MKEQLFAALAPRVEDFPVEGYGPVRLRELLVEEVDTVSAKIKAMGPDAPMSELGLQMLLLSAVDEAGATLFTVEDLPPLRKSGSQKIQALIRKVLEINGRPTAEGKEAAKNGFAPTASGASASA